MKQETKKEDNGKKQEAKVETTIENKIETISPKKEENKSETIPPEKKENKIETPEKKTNKMPLIIILVVIGLIAVIGGGYYIATQVLDSYSNEEEKDEDKDDKKDKNNDKDKKDDKDDDKDDDNVKDDKEDNKQDDNKQEEDKKDEQKYQTLNPYEISKFNSLGYATISVKEKDINGHDTTKYYVIDRNLQVVKQVDSNIYLNNFYKVSTQNNQTVVTNKLGETVFTSKEFEYKKAEIIKDKYLVVTRQIDTYNSSTKETGIYNLVTKKMVVEPNEAYYSNVAECGDYMIVLDQDRTKFFNTRLEKIITYEPDLIGSIDYFSNGYISYNNTWPDNNIKVIKDTGEVLEIKNPYDDVFIDFEDHKNNYFFQNFSHTSYILDVINQKLTSIGQEYYNIDNDPLFTKSGYALISFENQGNAKYYTIIDNTGTKLFEPVRIDSQGTEKLKSENLSEEGYYLITKDNKDIVMNYKHEEVLKAQDGETFTSLDGNLIKITKTTGNGDKEMYFKNIEGIKINIEIKKAN